MLFVRFFFSWCTCLIWSCAILNGQTLLHQFKPGKTWNDTNGIPINAHGGGVIHVDGRYYWYGEHKLPGKSEKQGADGGVHCYSSTDLYNWEDEGIVLSVDYRDGQSDIAAGCILERPKVVYNAKTRMYVMYFKLYPKGTGYDAGYVGVATSNSPDGPFAYRHKFLGAGSPKGSGDFCMYQDKDGSVYHFTVRKPDKAFCNGRLRRDYLYPEGGYKVMEEIPLHTEAPAIVHTLGKYYMLGSGSSGWAPNAARSFSSKTLTGGYEELGNPCAGVNPNNQLAPDKTFGGQISFILPVEGRKDCYIAMFDIWNPDLAANGLYVWLPLRFREGKPVVEWRNEWDLSIFDKKPVSIVLDTDCGPDYDDLGALAFLHCAASKGDADILATVVSNRHELSAPCLQAINTYYGRSGIPIGAPKNDGPNIGSWENWLDTLSAKYPHAIPQTSSFPDAVDVYRKTLANADDHSIVMVTTGFFTNLKNLLQSLPDQHSSLAGIDLVRTKVKLLVSMAGEFPTGFETNIKVDSKASKYAIDHWPTPIVFSGAEVGRKILTGLKLIHNENITNNPVKDTYKLVMTHVPRDKNGRSSYDQTAVMYAIYGSSDFFDLEQGRFILDDQGNNSWEKSVSGPHFRLILKSTETSIAGFIEDKMMCLK